MQDIAFTFQKVVLFIPNKNDSELDVVWWTPMPDIVISTFAASFPIFWIEYKEDTQETIIGNGYKYQ